MYCISILKMKLTIFLMIKTDTNIGKQVVGGRRPVMCNPLTDSLQRVLSYTKIRKASKCHLRGVFQKMTNSRNRYSASRSTWTHGSAMSSGDLYARLWLDKAKPSTIQLQFPWGSGGQWTRVSGVIRLSKRQCQKYLLPIQLLSGFITVTKEIH